MRKPSEEDQYTLLIGRALSTFGRVEMSLAMTFSLAVQSVDPPAAEKVFWAVNSLEARTAMVGAALKGVVPRLRDADFLLEEWVDLAKIIPKMAAKRAELAHGMFLRMGWATRSTAKREDQFFAPYYGKAATEAEPHRNSPKWDPRPKKRLYLPDLEVRIREFLELDLRIHHFTAKLSGKLAQANHPTVIRPLPLIR